MLRKYPFYFKSTVILLGLISLVYALSMLKDICVPLVFALLLALLLNPLHNWFQLKGIHKFWSILFCVVIAFSLILAIIYILSSQIINFGDQLPVLKHKFSVIFLQFQHWLYDHIGLNYQKQDQLISEVKNEMKPIVAETLDTALSTIGLAVLLPVYTALFLYYKTLMLNFLFEVFAEKNSKEVSIVLQETKFAIQKYMQGLLMEAMIVAAMNTLALWLLGVPYALLLGVIGAILNILPYIGGIASTLLPVAVATLTKHGFETQIWIMLAYMVIQFVDNHFLIPFIVSSQVRINALISIVIVLLGNALWGVPGMFLAIPMIGVLKIIFDRVPELKPWGRVLGDEIPTRHKGEKWFSRYRRSKNAVEKVAVPEEGS